MAKEGKKVKSVEETSAKVEPVKSKSTSVKLVSAVYALTDTVNGVRYSKNPPTT